MKILRKFVPKRPIITCDASDNGLTLYRWRAIIWTNESIVFRRLYELQCLNEQKPE